MINHVGYLTKMISNSVEKKLNNEFGIYDLSSTQASVLRYLRKNQDKAVYQKDLEVEFKCTHPTITGILRRLEGKGFIQCICDETDRRKKKINISDKGIFLLNKVNTEIDRTENQLIKNLSIEEQELLIKLLNQVLNNIATQVDSTPKQTEEK